MVVSRQNNRSVTFIDDFDEDIDEIDTDKLRKLHELENKRVRVDQMGDVNHIYNFYMPPNEGNSNFH